MGKAQRKNTGEVIVNIIVAVILIFTFIMTINILISNKKGYVSLFGSTAIAVKTDSMNGDKENSFAKGDLIFIRIVEGNEHNEDRQNLKVGDIVTFVSGDVDGDGRNDLISHRIVDLEIAKDGTLMNLLVKGDNPKAIEVQKISSSAVIGVYTGKIKGIGNFSLFIHTQLGFGVTVVLPSLLIVIYCIFVVIKNVKESKEDTAKAALTEEEREKIRLEVIKEMTEKQSEDKDKE